MAINTTLNTRIRLKYDTYENWLKTDVTGKGGNTVLLEGEVGLCYVPGGENATSPNQATPPAVLMKVGDGNKAFKDLPWMSALAADVYAWAKNEHINYADFYTNNTPENKAAIEGLIKANSAAYEYRMTEVKTGDVITGYQLEKHDTLEKVAEGAQPTWTKVSDVKVSDIIGQLDVTDTAVDHQFVTAVSETDGKITVSRAALTADDIPDLTLAKITDAGTAAASNVATVAIGAENEATDALPTVAQVKAYVASIDGDMDARVDKLEATHATKTTGEGETAVTSFKTVAEEVKDGIDALDATVRGSLSEEDAVADNKHVGVKVVEEDGKLTGVTVVERFGTAADKNFATVDIGATGEDTTALPTVAQVKKYVADEVADLEGATHFIGVKTELPTTADNGDICIVGVKEYIYVAEDGWKELGDETIYATKSTTIAGVDLQDNITKEELLTALNVADGAQVNVIEKVQVNGTDLTITNKTVNVTIAEGDTAGTIKVNGAEVAVKGVGDVDNKIKTAIEALDNPDNTSAAVAGITVQVDEEDGVVATPVVTVANNAVTYTAAKDGNAANLSVAEAGNVLKGDAIAAIKSYTDAKAAEASAANTAAIEALDATATLATVDADSGVLTVAKTVEETDGKIAAGTETYTISKIGQTGNIDDILQTENTYVVFDCGSSTKVI